ncbi:hypothetical protein N602_32095 [Mycobacterium avium subsp. hominissuis 10-5606]|nr:hypothetical protein N602_32095 [Mycobacterium avium subsp. hominissuis 10-5606]
MEDGETRVVNVMFYEIDRVALSRLQRLIG